MILWIRSQDKKRLIECHELGLQEKLQGQFAVIIANRHIVGTYKNKERAIQVLNSIEARIFEQGCFNISDGDTARLALIYDMPQE